MNFSQVVELAGEFAASADVSTWARREPPRVFSRGDNRSAFVNLILDWLWFAAQKNFNSGRCFDWLARDSTSGLQPHQLQSLRWWSRLCELSSLVQNDALTVVLRSTLEFAEVSNSGGGVRRRIERLDVPQGHLLLLVMDGNELTPAGMHSQRNSWLESFLAATDELRLGLCLIAKQPLLAEQRGERQQNFSDYRWRPTRQNGGSVSLQEVLRRGSWDRLCAALALGERILAEKNVMSGRN